MNNIGWIILFVVTGLLLGVIGMWRILRRNKSGYAAQEKNSNQGLVTLGSTFVVLGIVFSTTTNRIIGYSLIGVGVALSIISGIKSRRKEQTSMEVG